MLHKDYLHKKIFFKLNIPTKIQIIEFYPVKRKKKNGLKLNIWFTPFCRNFIFVVIYVVFSPRKSIFPKFQSSQEKSFFFCPISFICHLSQLSSLCESYVISVREAIRKKKAD